MWRATKGIKRTILKNENILSVYKKAGYKIEEIKDTKKEHVQEVETVVEEQKQEPEKEKPSRTDIMKMNKEQLIALAKELGIEVTEDATKPILQKALLEQ